MTCMTYSAATVSDAGQAAAGFVISKYPHVNCTADNHFLLVQLVNDCTKSCEILSVIIIQIIVTFFYCGELLTSLIFLTLHVETK